MKDAYVLYKKAKVYYDHQILPRKYQASQPRDQKKGEGIGGISSPENNGQKIRVKQKCCQTRIFTGQRICYGEIIAPC
jgi:hypothetical protein